MSTEPAAEVRLRRHARRAGEVIRKSRREAGEPWGTGRYRYLVIDPRRNFAVDAGDDPEDLLRRYAAKPDGRKG